MKKLYFLITFGILTGVIIVLSLLIINLGNVQGYYPEISYVGLSKAEQEKASKIISELDPLYMQLAHTITVVNDLDLHCDVGKIACVSCKQMDCVGLNFEQGVAVEYINDYQFKETLCHELLHSVFIPTGPSPDSLAHQIIYDQAAKEVCY